MRGGVTLAFPPARVSGAGSSARAARTSSGSTVASKSSASGGRASRRARQADRRRAGHAPDVLQCGSQAVERREPRIELAEVEDHVAAGGAHRAGRVERDVGGHAGHARAPERGGEPPHAERIGRIAHLPGAHRDRPRQPAMAAAGADARELHAMARLAATTLERDAALGAALQGLDVGERRHAGGVERAPRQRERFGEIRVDRGAHVLHGDSRHELERERAVPERGDADPPGELAAAERAARERERAAPVRHDDPEVREGDLGPVELGFGPDRSGLAERREPAPGARDPQAAERAGPHDPGRHADALDVAGQRRGRAREAAPGRGRAP